VAAALQAVFITRGATTIVPANVAAATNSDCTACDTFAFAYQYVLTTPGPVFLSDAARQQISQLRQDAAAAVAENIPPPQLLAELDAIAAEFKQTIDQDLQRAGVDAQAAVNQKVAFTPTGG
jgi:hypothetical protein